MGTCVPIDVVTVFSSVLSPAKCSRYLRSSGIVCNHKTIHMVLASDAYLPHTLDIAVLLWASPIRDDYHLNDHGSASAASPSSYSVSSHSVLHIQNTVHNDLP